MCQKERHKGGELFAAVFTMGDVQRGKRCKFPRGRLWSMILVFKSSKGKALIFVCLFVCFEALDLMLNKDQMIPVALDNDRYLKLFGVQET